jgi:hypothetical protein
MSKEKQPLSPELLEEAITIFIGGTDTYTVNTYSARPYPIEYVPFRVARAVARTMTKAGFEPAEKLHLDPQLDEGIKSNVQNWQDIEARRERIATILNRYGGPYHSFNPN